MTAFVNALRDRNALSLLVVLILRRVAGAAFPVVLVVATADVRGLAAAALVQGFRVTALAGTAPFRARLLDRIGRARVIRPQIVVSSAALVALAICSVTRSIPLWAVAVCAVVMALTNPSLDAVIRTVWRMTGRTEAEVKALHSYDSIIEEAGFLVGPFLASILMLALGHRVALYVFAVGVVAGMVSALIPAAIRTTLKRTAAKQPAAVPAKDSGRGARVGRALRTMAGPIATPELQRIVAPLILMGVELGIVAIAAPAISSAHGNSGFSGFIIASISLGGIVGAFGYRSLRLGDSLRRRHALLGLVFGLPLLFGTWAHSPEMLGLLLAVAGLAVTPLYINAYLMMDADIPRSAIHEANTWVPVGNDVGYVIGLTTAGALSHHASLHGLSTSLSIAAVVLVVYSMLQLRGGSQQPTETDTADAEVSSTATTAA